MTMRRFLLIASIHSLGKPMTNYRTGCNPMTSISVTTWLYLFLGIGNLSYRVSATKKTEILTLVLHNSFKNIKMGPMTGYRFRKDPVSCVWWPAWVQRSLQNTATSTWTSAVMPTRRPTSMVINSEASAPRWLGKNSPGQWTGSG